MKIGFIGSGKMAEAIIKALLKKGIAAQADISASDVSPERRQFVESAHGIRTTADNISVAKSAQLLVLAVKPQQLRDALVEIAPAVTAKHLVISIAAGKKIAWIESLLPEARVIRVMPNVACLVSEGMSAFALGVRATDADRKLAAELLSSFGRAVEVPEAQFDAVTAISGSGPAFFAHVLNKMAEAAQAEGLSRRDALALGAQTMVGTGKLLMDAGMEPAELIASVTSAKGTTAEGFKVLDASEIGAILRDTIKAAARRSRELSEG